MLPLASEEAAGFEGLMFSVIHFGGGRGHGTTVEILQLLRKCRVDVGSKTIELEEANED
jgi:hypothetical protein